MTINRSQGQTFKAFGILLPNPCFAHGQLYVALSRVGIADDVKVLLFPDIIPGPHQHKNLTRNVVYPDILTTRLSEVGNTYAV